MAAHEHSWERRTDADDNAATMKYRCACGRWGFGTFVQGRGLVVRPHGETRSRRLERGDVTVARAIRGHSPCVDPGWESLRERDS